MQRIVFVDDEQNVLAGLRRSLRDMRSEWDMEFCSRPLEAMELIRNGPVDVVVSDMRMPHLNGAALLAEVKRISPGTIRIILSGQADTQLIMSAVRVTHAYLHKPCDIDVLKAAIERARRRREFISDPQLQKAIIQSDQIRSLPEVYWQVRQAVSQGEVSFVEIGRLVAQDVGMSARLLQIVNSTAFNLRGPVERIDQAVALLGLDRLQQLILGAGVFSTFNREVDVAMAKESWRQSLAASRLAAKISADLGLTARAADTACTAAMLHLCGRLLLLAEFPQRYQAAIQRVRDEHMSLLQAEDEEFGVGQERVGAYLCSLWGLPEPMVHAIGSQVNPGPALKSKADATTALHVACALSWDPRNEEIDQEYLAALGVDQRLPDWRHAAEELHKEMAA